jgi:hypothetical protein
MAVRATAQNNANNTYGNEASQSFSNAQQDIQQAQGDQANLAAGKNVGANPYLNPQYLSAVNRLRSGALDQENNAADAQLRANNARTGGMNSTATTGAIGKLALDKMRLGNQLGAEQTAGDWTKNIGYQLNLAQMPLADASAQTGLYTTAQRGQSSALNDLTQEDLAQMQLAAAGISAAGAAAGGAACPAEGSLFLMADGSETPAEDLRVGDLLGAIDGLPEAIEKIFWVDLPILAVTTENGLTLRNSLTHCFVMQNDGFTLAAESLGKEIKTLVGYSKVVGVEDAGFARVFDVRTKRTHTYCADGAWALGVGHAASDEACERYLEQFIEVS